MKNLVSLHSLFLLLFFTLLLNSCKSGYEASRYSHLKYVKKQVGSENAVSLQRQGKQQSEMPDKQSLLSLQAPDNAFASADEKPSLRLLGSHHDIISIGAHQFPQTGESPCIENNALGNTIGHSDYSFKYKFEDLKAFASTDITQDQDKLLLLWLVLGGAAIVLSLLITVSWVFGVFATIAGIAAVVFFVLWIINIAKS